jgi:hypothetical protein
MAKLHKVEMYILDSADDYNSLEQIIDHTNDRSYVQFNPFNSQTVEFEFDDEHPLNFNDAKVEDYRKMFEK